MGATVSLTSGHHPQTNGQMERLNKELENGLWCLASRNPTSWSKHVMWVEFAHNRLPCFSVGLAHIQCVWVSATIVSGVGEGGQCPLCPCLGLLLVKDVGSVLSNPPKHFPVPQEICGQKEEGSGRLSDWMSVAVDQTLCR